MAGTERSALDVAFDALDAGESPVIMFATKRSGGKLVFAPIVGIDNEEEG